jgi:hypothetical protein
LEASGAQRYKSASICARIVSKDPRCAGAYPTREWRVPGSHTFDQLRRDQLAGQWIQRSPVLHRALQFLTASVRADGSWPIDTNLATWVTTLRSTRLEIACPRTARLNPRVVLRQAPRPALACVLLCRFLQQVPQQRRNLNAGTSNKALRLRLGAGPLALRLPRNRGHQKGELECIP